ncbi:2OG-Fe(II) oxygenase [Ruegeria sp. 2205SS24-7]|uniref:2OG-Fe(II) oxygenase n=1 Tax=Ruegeria discodermiae TaxID=3064389 RepID=UPI002740A8E5|nr:2OG-Fe(II) oxygenase [Ruegeria sp. 2205SS24-7]MDP5215889.1 2OG-Fe(II) oxygenase [Ruegeria sp. 2205SS24-7]
MATYLNLLPGDVAPDFVQRSFQNPQFVFNSAAGRYLVLCFFCSASDPHGQAALQAMFERTDLFDDTFASFFGVTIDPTDDDPAQLTEQYPGYRFFLDLDLSVSRRYGVVDKDATELPPAPEIRRLWVVIDPTMRVMKLITFKTDQSDIAELTAYLDALPPPMRFSGLELQAPIIVLPNVFEAELCDRLISLYEADGGTETGFMRDEGGKTVAKIDRKHKSRRDFQIEDSALIRELQGRVNRRVVPEIAKIHQFHVTRMERYIVSCYSAEDGGHFRPHRDNTTKGTAHRRFAVSINLNADFDGGEVSFPEYGTRSFKAPPGGAVIFSCSLLHAVSKVTRGRRYAFLPFLYDDAAAEIRERNNKYLSEEVGTYRDTAPSPAG